MPEDDPKPQGGPHLKDIAPSCVSVPLVPENRTQIPYVVLQLSTSTR
ncbi:mCG1044589, isoform CRA_a [Mus musculus]|nr:mCG1044589, isoform CRA_a [Mus musculus]EDL08866.1 mCG1044589, isoform CRA_a [Mus musculus]